MIKLGVKLPWTRVQMQVTVWATPLSFKRGTSLCAKDRKGDTSFTSLKRGTSLCAEHRNGDTSFTSLKRGTSLCAEHRNGDTSFTSLKRGTSLCTKHRKGDTTFTSHPSGTRSSVADVILPSTGQVNYNSTKQKINKSSHFSTFVTI